MSATSMQKPWQQTAMKTPVSSNTFHIFCVALSFIFFQCSAHRFPLPSYPVRIWKMNMKGRISHLIKDAVTSLPIGCECIDKFMAQVLLVTKCTLRCGKRCSERAVVTKIAIQHLGFHSFKRVVPVLSEQHLEYHWRFILQHVSTSRTPVLESPVRLVAL